MSGPLVLKLGTCPPVLRILLMLLEVVIEFMKSQERKMKAKKKNGNEKEWFH